MIRAVLFHPLGAMLLCGSLLLAGTLRFLPWAGGLSSMAPWVLFMGVVGYTALMVALLWPGPEDSSAVSQQLDADLSDSKIKNRLRSEALRHPATLLSLALVVVSACYLALLQSAFGGGLAVMAVGAVSLTAGAGTYLWHYVMHYREHYAAMVRWLTIVSTEARDRAEQAELARLRKRLEEGFPAMGSDLGQKALMGLNAEFLKLGPPWKTMGKRPL